MGLSISIKYPEHLFGYGYFSKNLESPVQVLGAPLGGYHWINIPRPETDLGKWITLEVFSRLTTATKSEAESNQGQKG